MPRNITKPYSHRLFPLLPHPGVAGRLPLGGAAVLIALLATAPGALAQVTIGAGTGWTVPGGDPQGTRFSRLAEINPANVGTLVPDFTIATKSTGNHEGQPLVVGTVMYVVTPFPHTVMALDLANAGKTLWTFKPPSNGAARGKACCDLVNRGATYAPGRIIFNTLDGATFALDATTGTKLWSQQLADVSSGMTISGAPIVADGTVLVGNAGGENGVRGWMAGLNLNTGVIKWQAKSTGPDAAVKIGPGFAAFYPKDQGANLGQTSWGGTTLWEHGGGAPWSWITFDPELDLIFYGTGNPGVWNPDLRPGDNKWGATIFARRPATGEAVWAYQVTPHDGWDFDSISESIVFDATFNGTPRKLLAHFDKNGFAYTMDRATGQVLVAKPYVNVTWATGVDLATGMPNVVASKSPHVGTPTSGICPTPLGGKDYMPAAYSPRTNLFYVPTTNLCTTTEPLRVAYIKGAPFVGADNQIVPGPGGNLGALVAWDALSGSKSWSIPETLPVYGGILATAGNLVFYGTLDRHFKAVNAKTGQVLFNTVLDCGIGANPISFTGADGHQRIAVYSGIGWLAGAFAGGACPSEPGTGGSGPSSGTGTSGELHVFKLP